MCNHLIRALFFEGKIMWKLIIREKAWRKFKINYNHYEKS
jgi:hypothetical protein